MRFTTLDATPPNVTINDVNGRDLVAHAALSINTLLWNGRGLFHAL
jgi:hypothetical protein